jgi:hypothetical protein
MWLVIIIIILDGFLHGNIWSKGFGGKSIFTSEVYTVFKVEYFLYIIQIMLQYTPSFNKVCYTLRLQGCFLWIYKTKYYAGAGGCVALGLCGSFYFYKNSCVTRQKLTFSVLLLLLIYFFLLKFNSGLIFLWNFVTDILIIFTESNLW